jgi:hypothetical protein
MKITARFAQGVNENKRYVLDYALDLAVGETVLTVAAPTITTPIGQADANSPLLVVEDITVGPGGIQVVFYVNTGIANGTYFVDFLATTSTSQVLEDVVAFNIRSFNI